MTEIKTLQLVKDYIREHYDLIDEESLTALQGIETFWEFAAIKEAARVLGYGVNPSPGIDCKLSRTDKPASYFKDANERCYRPGKRYTMRPLSAVAWLYELAQVREGEPLKSMVVIDFGDYRMVLGGNYL